MFWKWKKGRMVWLEDDRWIHTREQEYKGRVVCLASPFRTFLASWCCSCRSIKTVSEPWSEAAPDVRTGA